MPLNKLENFIKNTEGRILYVNPNDLDATDSIDNSGNSLTKPFKTIQRALLESARFSYLPGDNNDIVEKTTILLFPGEHIVDNRPGYAIKNIAGTATAVAPSGSTSPAITELSLTLSSVFDLTQPDNILYKFNSIYGGVVVPRGTSIVGLDLRKTKIRPKYVPNPTDIDVKNSSIFKITGACYFWQFSIFDGEETGVVYTDPVDFSLNNRSKPTFSHHKLTCFEYADGVNIPTGYDITDLDMYYSKLSNAFNLASGKDISQKYPSAQLGFSKQRPEWEIVGAFAADPINISAIFSGDGSTPSQVVTVTTTVAHGLTAGTPIKVVGVTGGNDLSTLYNVSTKVQSVLNENQFTYTIAFVPDGLPAGSAAGLTGSSATVTIETDTVSGASPYIFNISLRSVWGMNGMHADGSKASGFRSMVVAQFTAVSLQKDDRAFVKYNQENGVFDNIEIVRQTGSALSSASSSTNSTTVYHLDSRAIYRHGWQPIHIKVSNDSFIQIVSVFAIGFNKHFAVESGSDASITNSNSNFGQFSLSADGFKKEAFDKDNKAFITSIVAPRAITVAESNIDWIALDVAKTQQVGVSSHLYLFGFNNADDKPPVITQGYRIGAREGDTLYVETPSSGTKTASICMLDNILGAGTTIALGNTIYEKTYISSAPVSSILNLGPHDIQTGEKIRIISDVGDLPENITDNTVYYAIRHSSEEIKISGSKTNAEATNPIPISIYNGRQLKVVSKVSDKGAGEIGSPIQWDSTNSAWFIHVDSNNEIFSIINSLGVAGLTERTSVAYIKRFDDPRSLDEKIYKVRVVIPKELANARDPIEGFIIQESSATGVRNNSDFTLSNITKQDYLYNRNPRFITTCTYNSVNGLVTLVSDLPHNLKIGDQVIVKNATSTTNTSGTINKGYNGTFEVTSIVDDKTIGYGKTDIFGIIHDPGTFTNDTNIRNVSLPRFERNDLKGNFYIYRNEVITPYIYNVQDGVYYIYLLNSSNAVPSEFINLKYSQDVVNLYPQLDKDNISDNPPSSVTFAKRNPLGDVSTNDLKKSITSETVDKFFHYFGLSPIISGVSTSASGITTITFNREHGLDSIITYDSLNGGASHNPGTYYNVKIYNEASLTNWNGATAKVVVSGAGAVTSAEIISGGSGYVSGNTYYFDSNVIGGTPNARITLATSGISTSTGNTIQITGIGTTASVITRINAVPSKNSISIAQTSGDPYPTVGQYFLNVGPTPLTSSTSTSPTTGITSFTSSLPHGLVAGNRFRVLDTSNNNRGDYLVNEVFSPTSFTAKTTISLPNQVRILKHALSANEATADSSGENLGTRSSSLYQNEILILGQDITNNEQFIVSVPNAGVSTTTRFPLGSYIQINNEIMRITSSTLTGSGNNEIKVIRGSMGTIKENHLSGSLIRKIKPLAIEFRRPSILRASGHTFEYLGFGPGNYSTGLPQIQNITLSEKEEFLSQSQETSCGNVVYTGMNNNGDVFAGNTKTSASSGKIVSYDIPKPTVTGEDPNRLSVVFDEVIVKERILVEGGNSGQVLSQFDGPVTFNQELKFNDNLIMNSEVKINSTLFVTDTTQSVDKDTGCVVLEGGLGVEKNVNIGGNLNVTGITTLNSAVTINSPLTLNSNINMTTGIATFQQGGRFKDIQVGVTSVTEIDTVAGNLVLDSASGQVTIDDEAFITGNLVVANDITAFASDERLKTNIKPLENALDKVLQLSGFTYNFNETGGKLGFNTDITYVGVSAQEVQAVLPEAVKPAPVDETYITVQYEKLVPLLIEAIKELADKVQRLEDKINDK